MYSLKRDPESFVCFISKMQLSELDFFFPFPPQFLFFPLTNLCAVLFE